MLFYKLCRIFFAFLIKILFRFRIYGRENIPKKRGIIVASNHTSYLDPLFLGVALPRPIHYIVKEDLFKIRLIGGIIKRWGTIPIKRDVADINAIKEAIRLLNEGESIGIFPEGTRNPDGIFLNEEIKGGICLLAYKTGVCVVPAYINGSNKALPRGAKWIRFGCQISVHFGKPIITEATRKPKRMAYALFAQKVADSIRELAKH